MSSAHFGHDRQTEIEVTFGTSISSKSELRQLLPLPGSISVEKITNEIDQHCLRYINASPFAMLSSSDAAGRCDCSPRGGPPGFVRVLNDKCLLVPEVSGNRRADTLQNLIENPQIGMLFLVPGYGETLRVNGTGVVVRDPECLSKAPVMGKVPLLGIGVYVEEAYLHCAKAFKRSCLWEPGKWPRADLPSAAEIWRDHTKGRLGGGTIEDVQRLVEESYTKRMY